jgi:dTDP-4-dehydrorhamnose reductase
MERIPILGTGLSGLVGSKITELLADRFTFTNLDLTNKVDILQPDSIEAIVGTSPARVLLHLAAFTDVNAAQEQKDDKNGSCYRVNVEGTRNIAEACARHGIYLVLMSTGYVFDGTKTTGYVETDAKNPVDWYSQTKSWAEEVVTEICPSAAILRINFPYRQDALARLDIWHKMANALLAGKNGPFFDDHFFTLTPIEWLAETVMAPVITRQPAGIFHTTTDTVYSDYSLAQTIQQSLGLSGELLRSSVHEYNRTAARPYQPSLILDSTKLQRWLQST